MRDKLEQLADRLLDKLWDWIEPLAGKCPVCAFLRGMALGVIGWQLCYLLSQLGDWL